MCQKQQDYEKHMWGFNSFDLMVDGDLAAVSAYLYKTKEAIDELQRQIEE